MNRIPTEFKWKCLTESHLQVKNTFYIRFLYYLDLPLNFDYYYFIMYTEAILLG